MRLDVPAKDKHHDTVVRALQKEGWTINDDPYAIYLRKRRLYIDLAASKNDADMILVEVKGYENVSSPMNYLANIIGQYMLYKAALNLVANHSPLYLALPTQAYNLVASEEFVAHVVDLYSIRLVVYDIEREEIVIWIPSQTF